MFDRIIVAKVFLTKVVEDTSYVKCSGNDDASIWMKKASLEREHNELNDAHLKEILLWQV
jgi:hypothetical protein